MVITFTFGGMRQSSVFGDVAITTEMQVGN